jgi:hypothetical protein
MRKLLDRLAPLGFMAGNEGRKRSEREDGVTDEAFADRCAGRFGRVIGNMQEPQSIWQIGARYIRIVAEDRRSDDQRNIVAFEPFA